MNILEDIAFNENGPSVSKILVNDSVQYLGFALKKDVVFKDHKTTVPAILTVLSGKINFVTADAVVQLKKGEVFNIPIDELHRVEATEDSHFTVLKML